MSKKLLMIAWHFPPTLHTAAKRCGCFAKYLCTNGWDVTVVTPTATRECLDPLVVQNLPASIRLETVRLTTQRPTLLKPAQFFSPHRIPERWIRPAQERLTQLCQSISFDVVWASFPGWGGLPHFLANWVNRHWGTPWVADYRDIPGQFSTIPFRYRLRVPIERWHQRRIVNSSAAIVTVSTALAERLQRMHKRKVDVIENGFDPDDFPVRPKSALRVFNIFYGGTLRLHCQQPQIVLDALSMLVNTGAMKRGDIAIDFCGTDPNMVNHAFGSHPLRDVIKVSPRLGTIDYIEKMRASAVLLSLAIDRDPGLVTSKIYEYLASDRPILSVPQDTGCIDMLLKTTGAGVSLTNVHAVATQLSCWYEEWKQTGTFLVDRDQALLQRYSRKQQTLELMHILDRAMGVY